MEICLAAGWVVGIAAVVLIAACMRSSQLTAKGK